MTTWTTGDIRTVMTLFPAFGAAVAGAKIGKTSRQVQGLAQVLGLHREQRMPHPEKMQQSPVWSKKEWLLLKQHFATMPIEQIAAMLGRSELAVRAFANKAGLRRQGAAGRRGQRYPIGAERVNRDGHLERKVTDAPNVSRRDAWKRVDLIEWEKLHGPMPKGFVLVVTNPKLPTTPDNLAAMTRTEAMRRFASRQSPEMRALHQLQGQITTQVRRLERAAESRASKSTC